NTVVIRSLDRPAERARVPEPRIVDQHDQDVRRPLRRLDVADQLPARLRVGQRLPGHPGERWAPDGQSAAVDRFGAHVTLLVGTGIHAFTGIRALTRAFASSAANARACAG